MVKRGDLCFLRWHPRQEYLFFNFGVWTWNLKFKKKAFSLC